jgi:hypothetical protein
VKLWRKSFVLVLALLAFGTARLPYEAGLGRDFRNAGLYPTRLAIGTREHIDQTSSAVALGGLRTLVATFLNLRAFTAFTEQRWEDVAKTYNTIVDLAPRTRYYWETGSWQLAYNAASYYLNDSKLPPLRRREAWRSYIMQGRAFLERGIRNNPDDWSLLANLGFLLADPNKFPALRDTHASFSAAAAAYQKSAATGKAPAYVRRAWFYALARVVGREAEALALARALYAEGPKNRTPTLLMLLLVLEAHDNPSLDVARRAVELFGTPEKAYAALAGHWQRTRERFPVFGVSAALETLETSLAIPKDQSILGKALPPPPSPDDWFRN